jgi:S-methylmethionine-dependent homocysteine/selenocysteine methylase
MREFTILDGGMGRELKRIGAPFRQPEWSALALIQAPEAVLGVHRSYIAAGAEVITSNSYAVVPFHIGADRFDSEAKSLCDLAGRLARQAADERPERAVRVAASLPPLFGSYRPDLFDPGEAARLLAPLVEGLSAHADLWLAETLSSTAEARVVVAALAGDARPLWLSFTLDDEAEGRLRSGEPVEAAARLARESGAQAILFNCSQPEVMEGAIGSALAQAGGLEVGVYANAFPPQPKDAQANATLSELREDLDPAGYSVWVRKWLTAGASIVGGCCGIGPEHIAALAALEQMQ